MKSEITYIPLNSSVAIKNLRDNKFLQLNTKSQSISSEGLHPVLRFSASHLRTSFTLISSAKERGNLHFNSVVYLLASPDTYLGFKTSGEIKLENSESPTCRWTIVDPKNPTSRRRVCCYDDIGFKTPFGLMVSDSKGDILANGQANSPESTWRILKADFPYMPDWVYTRANIAHNSLVCEIKTRRAKRYPDAVLGSFPLEGQENLLIEDLMFSLCSIEGTYIKKRERDGKFEYEIEPHLENPTCDESLLFLVCKILPLCKKHDQVLGFLNSQSNYEYGLVSHALCEAIESLLKEYRLRITQIDSEFSKGDLTLQKLWFYLQPCIRTLESLTKFIEEAQNLKGGALLNAIYRCMNSATEQNTKKLYSFLLEKSAIPYLNMLSLWIHYGEIKDPYQEFLIKERKDLSKDNLHIDFQNPYWEERFKFREEQIPLFLQKLQDKVLLTGKYLDVIKECEESVECPYSGELDPKKNPKLLSNIGNHREFLEPIENAYNWAAKSLLDLILGKERLIDRLKSIKHYFLLDLGDLFVHFMDSAEEELDQSIREVSIEKLKSLLDLALRTSSTNADPFKEDVTCDLASFTVLQQLFALHNITEGTAQKTEDMPSIFSAEPNLKGLHKFVLDYKVRWPITLIISRNSLLKYQLIFRHLFFCKYVERQLSATWLIHQSYRELKVYSAFFPSYTLVQRMLHFVKNYVYYMSVEVLEEKWHTFIHKLKNVETIDSIMQLHTSFLDDCLKECLLMDQELYLVLEKIIRNCLNFSETIKNYSASIKSESLVSDIMDSPGKNYMDKRKNKLDEESSTTRRVLEINKYSQIIKQYQGKFEEHMKAFLNTIYESRSRSDTHLINLIIRLDYNGYYSEKLLMLEET